MRGKPVEINAGMVKELREKSGAGIMECKRALKETKGDLRQAIDYLRKEGIVKAEKKSGRAASEGLIGQVLSKDHAALVEVNCETDFVARTDPFQDFLKKIGDVVLGDSPKDLDALLALKLREGTVHEILQALIARLGENMAIRRFAVLKAGAKEKLGAYLHAGSKIGVLVKLRGEKIDESIGREVAMHVAAMHPTFLNRESVPAEVLTREKEILSQSPELKGKPAELMKKIVQGKLARYFSENCLLEQPFVKDNSGKQTVAAFLKSKDPQATVLEMVRFQVGENV